MAIRHLSRLRSFDYRLKKNFRLVAGVDEAGCAPLAGPVVAAAVILFRHRKLALLNDSKKVPQETRLRLFYEIVSNGLVGIGTASEEEIDAINIFHASCLAMKRAVMQLNLTPGLLLVDGNRRIDIPLPQKKIIRGDGRSASIAAASIIAKVYRDRWMGELDKKYPGYLFSKHKGYGTREHLECLKLQGPCAIHRRSFMPVKQCLEDGYEAVSA